MLVTFRGNLLTTLERLRLAMVSGLTLFQLVISPSQLIYQAQQGQSLRT